MAGMRLWVLGGGWWGGVVRAESADAARAMWEADEATYFDKLPPDVNVTEISADGPAEILLIVED